MINRRLLLVMLLLGLAAQGATPGMAGEDDGRDGRDGHSKSDSSGDSKSDSSGDSKSDSSGDSRDDNSGSANEDDGSGSPRDRSGGRLGNRNNYDDWIRKEVSEGKVEPLRKILATVREQYGGQVVRVRLSGQGGRRLYQIRIIDTSNQLIEVQVNANTGNIVVPSGIY